MHSVLLPYPSIQGECHKKDLKSKRESVASEQRHRKRGSGRERILINFLK